MRSVGARRSRSSNARGCQLTLKLRGCQLSSKLSGGQLSLKLCGGQLSLKLSWCRLSIMSDVREVYLEPQMIESMLSVRMVQFRRLHGVQGPPTDVSVVIELRRGCIETRCGTDKCGPEPPLRGGSVFFDPDESFQILCSEGRHYREFFLAVFVFRRTGAALDEVDDAPRQGMNGVL